MLDMVGKHHTAQFLIQNFQLGICVIDDLIHLNVEAAILVRQRLGEVFLVHTGSSQQDERNA